MSLQFYQNKLQLSIFYLGNLQSYPQLTLLLISLPKILPIIPLSLTTPPQSSSPPALFDNFNQRIKLEMKIYDFTKIISEIGKGAEIDISSLNKILSSKARLKQLRKTEIQSESIASLLRSLAHVNLAKLILTVVLMVVQLGLTIASPFLTNYLIDNYLKYPDSLLLGLILIFAGYKVAKFTISIICNYCYQSLGFEFFARLYWYVLANYRSISGKMLNLIEYDCNMLANLPYASLTAFFDAIEILVILGLFTYYLSSLSSFSTFAVIIVLFLCNQALVSYFTLRFTKKYLLEKDKRLSFNINNDLSGEMMLQREHELAYNRKLLYIKILAKCVAIIYPILINLFVFVIADRTKITDVEYILLILINLIRNPISELLFTLNMMVQVSYSIRRIINFAKGHVDQIERGNLGSEQSEQIAEIVGEDAQIGQKQLQIKSQLKAGISLNRQKGLVKMKVIVDYCIKSQSINEIYWILLLLAIALVLAGKFYNYYITKHIIADTYTYLDFLGLAYQFIIPLLFYFLLIVISQKIARSLFSQLKEGTFNCEFLNRISGDITAIDRSITIYINQAVTSFTFIISSYLYSIISLKDTSIQIGLIAFLMICLIIAVKANRFIMHSRREVARQECLLKSKIISRIVKRQKIQASKAMQKSWRNIFQCKQMGLFIEIYFMILLNIILLVFSLFLVGLCKELEIDPINKSILLIACLNVDYDLINTFFSAVRLEICLVSFERVINALKPK